MKTKILLLIFLLSGTFLLGQNQSRDTSLIITRDGKTKDLSKLKKFEIYQIACSGDKDSIRATFFAYSIKRQNDTLIIFPKKFNRTNLFDTTDTWSQTKFYERDSSPAIKVPINQITVIKAKNQPLAYILSAVVATAYVSYITSIFVAVTAPKYADPALSSFFVSGAVLITVWPSYFIWAKKRYWLNSKKKKKNWAFR